MPIATTLPNPPTFGVPVAPKLVPERLVTPEDYPDIAIRSNEQGYVEWRVTIDPLGRPLRCEITSSKRLPTLEKTTCAIMMRRARFLQARDATGQPTFGVVAGSTAFTLPDSQPVPQRPPPYDLLVTLNRLPGNPTKPSIVQAMFIVSPDGTMGACAATPELGLERLAPLACDQLRSSGRPKAALDGEGNPVISVQSAHVAFATAAMLSVGSQNDR